MRRLAVHFALSGVLAAALLWFLQNQLLADAVSEHGSGWAALWGAVREIPWWAVPVYGLSFLGVHLLRTWRWVLQVKPLGESDTRLIFRVCAVGYAAIVLFPLRLGELVRPYLLARVSPKIRFAEAMGTAVVERIIDGLCITALFFVAVLTAPQELDRQVRAAGVVSALVFGCAALGLTLFVLQRAWAERLMRWTFGLLDAGLERVAGRQLGLVEKIGGLMDGFVEGLRSLRGDGALPWFVVLTVAYWTLNAVGIWILARTFGLPLPLLGGFGVLSVLVIGIMVPSAPGFLGVFQFALAAGLSLYFTVESDGAAVISFALVMNVVQIVIQTGFAVPFLGGLGMRFGDIFALQKEATERATE